MLSAAILVWGFKGLRVNNCNSNLKPPLLFSSNLKAPLFLESYHRQNRRDLNLRSMPQYDILC